MAKTKSSMVQEKTTARERLRQDASKARKLLKGMTRTGVDEYRNKKGSFYTAGNVNRMKDAIKRDAAARKKEKSLTTRKGSDMAVKKPASKKAATKATAKKLGVKSAPSVKATSRATATKKSTARAKSTKFYNPKDKEKIKKAYTKDRQFMNSLTLDKKTEQYKTPKGRVVSQGEMSRVQARINKNKAAARKLGIKSVGTGTSG